MKVQPSIDEVQDTLIKGAMIIISVSKGVSQWIKHQKSTQVMSSTVPPRSSGSFCCKSVNRPCGFCIRNRYQRNRQELAVHGTRRGSRQKRDMSFQFSKRISTSMFSSTRTSPRPTPRYPRVSRVQNWSVFNFRFPYPFPFCQKEERSVPAGASRHFWTLATIL